MTSTRPLCARLAGDSLLCVVSIADERAWNAAAVLLPVRVFHQRLHFRTKSAPRARSSSADRLFAVYHTVLGAHFTKFRLLTAFIMLINFGALICFVCDDSNCLAVTYVLTVLQIVAEKRYESLSDITSEASVWAFSVALLFVVRCPVRSSLLGAHSQPACPTRTGGWFSDVLDSAVLR